MDDGQLLCGGRSPQRESFWVLVSTDPDQLDGARDMNEDGRITLLQSFWVLVSFWILGFGFHRDLLVVLGFGFHREGSLRDSCFGFLFRFGFWFPIRST